MTANKTKRTKEAAKPKSARKLAAPPADDPGSELAFGAEPFIPPAGADASLHELFQRQTMEMLDCSDLSEEEKQSILVAMNCPCCGGSGLSFTMKLKRKR